MGLKNSYQTLTSTFKAHIPLETEFTLANQHKLNGHKQHGIYMANASPSHWGPNTTYLPPAHIGVGVEGNENVSVVRYQNVGIPNAILVLRHSGIDA